MSGSNAGRKFRSVLPHEPPFMADRNAANEHGYLHVQGSFTPKLKKKDENDTDDSQVLLETESFWLPKQDAVARVLSRQFQRLSVSPPPRHVEILDTRPPYTKVRLVFDTPEQARQCMWQYRQSKLTPASLFLAGGEGEDGHDGDSNGDSSELSSLYQVLRDHASHHHRQLQWTQVTTHPLAEPCWTRSNPPKFRRLIARQGEETTQLNSERKTTRFVVLTNLLPEDNSDAWNDQTPLEIANCIRSVLDQYDTTGKGIEVFVPSDIKKRSRYVHIGMRSAADAQNVVRNLQEEVVEWQCGLQPARTLLSPLISPRRIRSGKLFVDYAAITQRSVQKAARYNAGQDAERGMPPRPQCTSTTSQVEIPGLMLVPDFVTEPEEAALVAVLTGPQAPWAPQQQTASFEDGVVKRAVQHYGYVFDYRTANVLRDKESDGADCPPMPALPAGLVDACRKDEDKSGLLESYIKKCVDDGRGWEVLAGIIERTRRHRFSTDETGSSSFSHLNQLTVNQYKPGEGIGSHVDTPSAFADGLISISLNSSVVMVFRKTEADLSFKEGSQKLVFLPRRSLLLMSKDARYRWEHMIVSRMTDTHNDIVYTRGTRVSLTLRSALTVNGQSIMPLLQSQSFPPCWGSQNSRSGDLTCDIRVTPDCERKHVHAVYDAIATQWSHTRSKRGVLWPGATQFLKQILPGSIIADVGCGDGKYFPAVWESGSYVIGTDISEPLLRTAVHDSTRIEDDIPENRRVSSEKRHLRDRPAVAVADCMNLPLRTNSCDAAICIAVMHHLSTPSRRKRCIEELARIVRPGGLVNVQAWAMEQEEGSRRRFAANDVFVPFNAQPKYLKLNKEACTTKDALDGMSTAQVYSEAHDEVEYDDRKGLVVFKRYCHLYREGELDEIACSVPGIEIVESGFESGNYFIIFHVA